MWTDVGKSFGWNMLYIMDSRMKTTVAATTRRNQREIQERFFLGCSVTAGFSSELRNAIQSVLLNEYF